MEKNNSSRGKRRRRSKGRGCFLTVMVILAVTAVAAALFVRPPQSAGGDSTDTGTPSTSPNLEGNTGEGEEEDTTGGTAPKSAQRNGIYTFLVAGSTDGTNSDTIMVVMLDTKAGTVGMLSIPRDTYVDSAKREVKKINAALGSGGVDNLLDEVSELIGYRPEHYFLADPNGVAELVDKVGGITFDVPMNMNYDDPSQDLHIHLKAGEQPLNGEQAVGLLRYRQDNPKNGYIRGYPNGDLDRIDTQQKFLIAAAKQVMTPANLLKLNDMIDIYADNVDTDLTTGNLLWLAMKVYAIGTDNMNRATLPTYTLPVSSNPFYYQFVSDDAEDVVRSVVWPFDE